MAKKVIDISKHNGKIDFAQVKKAVDFIFIRAGFGWSFHLDPRLDEYIKGCREYKIPFGLYCYSYATNLNQAKVEVQGFLQKIQGLHPELPVVIDTEDADKWRLKNGNPSWGEKASMLLYQLREIERAGYYAMFYCSTSWYDQMVRREPALKKYDLWLAHWGIKEPSRPCGVWQYTSDGTVPGIRGRVDMNYAYRDYPTIIREKGLNGYIKPIQTPKVDKKEEAKAKKAPQPRAYLICYEGDGDKPAVDILAQALGTCAMVKKGAPPEEMRDSNIIQVGGEKKSWADIVLSGADRFKTRDAVLEFIKKMEGGR